MTTGSVRKGAPGNGPEHWRGDGRWLGAMFAMLLISMTLPSWGEPLLAMAGLSGQSFRSAWLLEFTLCTVVLPLGGGFLQYRSSRRFVVAARQWGPVLLYAANTAMYEVILLTATSWLAEIPVAISHGMVRLLETGLLVLAVVLVPLTFVVCTVRWYRQRPE